MSKPIMYKLETGGSSFGGSFYEKLISCGRKARLDAEAKSNHAAVADLPEADYFGRGHLYHAYQHLYWSQQIHAPDELALVKFEPGPDSETLAEAQRCMREYMLRHGQNLYGLIEANEEALPRSPAEAGIIEAAIGISPWTGRVDMRVNLHKKHLSELERAGLKLNEPGRYLVDFKMSGSEDGALRERMRWAHQFTGYLHAWGALAEAGLVKPVQGMIVDMCITTKSPRFLKWFVPNPSDVQIAGLQTRWLVADVLRRFLPDLPNAGDYNCFPRGQACRYWVTGLCNRTYSAQELVQIRKVLANSGT